MDHETETQILEAEERLRRAMLDSSVGELDELLDDDLLFTSHLGQVTTKEADLSAHASGAVKIDSLEFSDRQVRPLGEVAVVAVRVAIAGTFLGQAASGAFRFTRVWRRGPRGWRVVVAHSCLES